MYLDARYIEKRLIYSPISTSTGKISPSELCNLMVGIFGWERGGTFKKSRICIRTKLKNAIMYSLCSLMQSQYLSEIKNIWQDFNKQAKNFTKILKNN